MLRLASPVDVPGGEFTLTGTVRGTCLEFTMEETGHAGSFRFAFDGNRDGADVAGTFTGEGPPGCASTGDFRVTIRP
jgi:hypothetical protein